MGGTAVLIFTALHPDLVHGVVSLNGTANMLDYRGFPEAIAATYGGNKADRAREYRKRSPELFPNQFKGIPVAFTAGGKDNIVPPASVMRLSKALAQLNHDKVLMIYRDAGGHSTSYEDAKAALEFVINRALK